MERRTDDPVPLAVHRMNAEPFDPLAWPRVSACLDEVLDLAPDQRDGWLAALATTEPHIARRLRALLSEQEVLDAHEFLEQSPVAWTATASTDAAIAGQRVGAYTIERLIGRGGMGEVWLASRSDGRFEGRCAIKFLHRSLTQGAAVDRFRREGRLLARVSHPNIARLLDAGTTDDGRQYLVLEYVEGEPVDRYCHSQSLSIEARVRLCLDIVSAVAHAHASLIIHRDLKPSNVLVTREGAVKLLDFGIAKLLSADLNDDAGLTRFEGAFTPEYAAPEQLLGEMLSTATDVYQLGMLLYVLLAGRHPLPPSSGSRSERIKAALDGQLVRASEFATGTMRKQLRGDLDAILSMALRRDPGERYVTAAALRDDLTRYLNHEPVSARRGAMLYPVRKFIHRHRLAVLGSAIGVASLCAALVFAFAQARVASTQRDRALDLASRNEAVTAFLGTVITEAAQSEKPLTVSDLLDRSEQLALADASGNRENRAAVLVMLADSYHSSGEHVRALQLLEQSLTVLGDSPGSSDLRAQIRCARPVVMAVTGRAEEALQIITRELEHLPDDPRSAAECLHARALVAVAMTDAENTLRYANEALQRIRATGRPSKADEATYLGTAADAYHRMGQLDHSFEYYERALQSLDELGRSRGPVAIAMRNNWAVANDSAGVPKRALELYDENLRILSERDAGHPRPSSALATNRARALEAIGRYAEAEAAYRFAMQVAAQTHNKDAPVYCLLGLADLSRQKGDLIGAGRYAEQAAALLGPAEPADSVLSMKLALTRGRLDLAAGRVDEARAQFTRASTSKRSKNTAADAELAKAETELVAGNEAAGEAEARVALATATSIQGSLPYSRRTGLAWLLLGRALQMRGESQRAHDAFEAAIKNLSNTVDADHPALVQARSLMSGSDGAARQ
jgi:serine/threonine-protein kinase